MTSIQRCRRHRDCPYASQSDVFGYMCVRRVCVVALRSNFACAERSRCGIGGRCMNGFCFGLWDGFTQPSTTTLSDFDHLPEYNGTDAFATSSEELLDDMEE
ncbi:hypothetical protein TTRE_0000423201 [Trichuris trichiura]|uniref:DUF7107 domain-containing protein n=1 Tax=Trichuris trichiura TaxID=36087 RepID=A0A077Z8J3_TRITR|nr:hypothetical protein TTRE_0000423201 [Trichuris trichiura]